MGRSVLCAALLASLLCFSGFTLADREVGYGTYAYPVETYGGEPVYGAPNFPYDDQPADFGAGDFGYPPDAVPHRIDGSDRRDPYGFSGKDAYYGQTDVRGARSYPSKDEGLSYGWDEARRYGGPADGANAYAGEWGLPGGELPPAAARGYRFRGDAPNGEGAWGASTWRGGYRFRPLTKQERERRGNVSGWRPRQREASGGPAPHPAPLPANEAYGYESENWFRRYYRQRP